MRKQYEKDQQAKSAAAIAVEQRAMELAIQAFRAELTVRRPMTAFTLLPTRYQCDQRRLRTPSLATTG